MDGVLQTGARRDQGGGAGSGNPGEDQAVTALRVAASVAHPELLSAEAIPTFLSELGAAALSQGQRMARAGDYASARAAFRDSTILAPNRVEPWANLADALAMRSDWIGASAAYERAVTRDGHHAMIWVNYARTLYQLCLPVEAESAAREAVRLEPGNHAYHYALAQCLLIQGKFKEGWEEYEWRLSKPELKDAGDGARWGALEELGPLWKGEDLNGKRLLLYGEQGFGDNIQFCRFIPWLKRRYPGSRIAFNCWPALASLMRGLEGLDLLTLAGEEQIPAFDYHLSLMSLGGVLDLDASNVLAEVPYLKVSGIPPRAPTGPFPFQQRPIRAGICWRGRLEHPNDHQRSLPVKALEALRAISGIEWWSLQHDAQDRPDWMIAAIDGLDFRQTAEIINRLGLVISVDTCVAHLAGALGMPVWNLLCYAPDWRWGLGREDTPWYPTMRLFRQPEPRDWESVIQRVKIALSD